VQQIVSPLAASLTTAALPPPQELSTELRGTELKAADLESQLASSQHTVQQQADDMAELRRVVAALDAERDSLQAELDSRAEQAAQLREELQVAHKQFSDLQRCVTAWPAGHGLQGRHGAHPNIMHPVLAFQLRDT
jgi:septal ring factor EnvC (AmiA/AmiB activator)